MMQTTCVDEERIQRVDSTYLYLQQNNVRNKYAEEKIAIFTHTHTRPSFKEILKSARRLCLSWFQYTNRGVVILTQKQKKKMTAR